VSRNGGRRIPPLGSALISRISKLEVSGAVRFRSMIAAAASQLRKPTTATTSLRPPLIVLASSRRCGMQRVAVTNRRVLGCCGIAPRRSESAEITPHLVPIFSRFDSTHSDERNRTHLVENKQSAYPPLDTISDLCNAGFVAQALLSRFCMDQAPLPGLSVAQALLPACLKNTSQGRSRHKLFVVQETPALKSGIPHRKLAP
jgi:hypothetical protein